MKERIGNYNPSRPPEPHDRGVRTSGLLGCAEFEDPHDWYLRPDRERFEPGPQGGIVEGSKAIEHRHENNRGDEREDDRDRKAQQPRDQPPPGRPRREKPQQHHSGGDRQSQSETERLREILHPAAEALRR